jgi:hypothetical protein
MLTYADISAAIAEYDHNKGWISILLEPAHIKALRTYARNSRFPLSAADFVAVGKIILECQVSPTQTSFKTIEKLKGELPNFVTILHKNGLLSNDNLKIAMSFLSDLGDLGIGSLICKLDEVKLLNEDNLNVVFKLDKYRDLRDLVKYRDLVETLIAVAQANLLNVRTFTDVIAHRDVYNLSSIFNLLAKANLLTFDTLDAVLQNTSDHACFHLAVILNSLRVTGALNAINLASVLKHRSLSDLDSALRMTIDHPEPTIAGDEIDLIVKNPFPYHAAHFLHSYEYLKLFTPDHRYQILAHKNFFVVEEATKIMIEAELSTTENLTFVLAHPQSNYIAEAFVRLKHANVLTAENRASITVAENIEQLSKLLRRLHLSNILTQAAFDRLVTNPAFIESLAGCQLERLAAHQFTQAVFDTLFAHYNQANGNVAAAINRMNQYINRDVLDRNDANNQALNAAQNTHTASVHQTVSRSATALKQTYSTVIGNQVDVLIQQILAWSKTLDTSSSSTENSTQTALKRAAAQRAIARICGNDSLDGNYTDHTSQISTRQLLALIWHGIHDEHNRQGSLEDALQQLIEGLYEIQRGYNLDAHGKETNPHQNDLPICSAGTFNKLIEKMVGVLPQASIQMVTKQLASQKLPRVVYEVLINYLKSHPAREKIIDAIEAEDISVVWADIKKMIADKMFEEFGSLYQSKTDSDFINLIGSGVYVEMDDALLAKLKVPSPPTTPSLMATSSSLFHQSSSSSSTSSTSVSEASNDSEVRTKADMGR